MNCSGKNAAGVIGLAARAGKCESGAVAVQAAMKHGRALCLLVDGSASASTQDDYKQAALNAGIPCLILEDFDLGQVIGKPGRIAVAITDREFVRMIQNKICLNGSFKQPGSGGMV